jgi:NAD(P)-dependent dehydrogenase (short-subunit alcohol dehydrogenase family)
MPNSQPKTWFVTGAGQGLGRAITAAALERGDNVAASTRRLADVADLTERYGDRVLPLALDVRDRAACAPALAAARAAFGRIDVVVNNAARALSCAVEEATESEVRDVIDTNLLGALWVSQAALPILRAQGAGHLVQISSGGGIISWPINGVYQSSKYGLEGFSESLAQESRHLGIKVTIVQVGHMETAMGRNARSEGRPLPDYDEPRARMGGVSGRKGNDPGDLAPELLRLVDLPDPPLRMLLGRPIDDIRASYEERLRTWADGLPAMDGVP